MNDTTLTLALVSDVFAGDDGPARLAGRLHEARDLGAELAVLPELPLLGWSPATTTPRDDDAEPPNGPGARIQAAAAAAAGIGLVGGAIVRDETGRRQNTALVFDAAGQLRATYSKLHLPEEPGFWETSHYEPGTEPPSVIDGFALRLGVQICSDVNRPEGCHLLGAAGAELIAAPRATELATWPRWRPVIIANALTSGTYVASVNRPAPEDGVPLGGPSIVVAPDGRVIVETTDTVAVATLSRADIEEARRGYPGYLPVRCDLYAEAWRAAADRTPDQTPGPKRPK